MCTHLQAYNPDYMYLLHTIHQIKGKLCCSRKHPYLPWKDFFSLSLPLHHSGISGWASFKELYFWIPLPLEFKGKTECAIYAFLWNTTYISYHSKLRLGTFFLDRIPLYGGVLITITDTFIFLFLDKYGKLQSPCSFNLIQCECRNTGRKKVFLMIYFFVYKNKDKHKKLIEGVI